MTLNQAIETARAKTTDPKWIRAIDRAAAGLLDGSICVTLFCDGYALVTTPTGQHKVNGRCDCTAAQHGHTQCVHRCAKRIAEMMEETAPVVVSRASLIAEIKTAWSQKFPTDNLADALMYRFKVNSLQFLADDMLAGVLAVAM